MERVLKDLANEASIPKFYTIKKACLDALDFLLSPNAKEVPAYQLRNRCLEPFQMALETRTKRLSNMAIKGIEMILQDNQFQSTMESESEEKTASFSNIEDNLYFTKLAGRCTDRNYQVAFKHVFIICLVC